MDLQLQLRPTTDGLSVRCVVDWRYGDEACLVRLADMLDALLSSADRAKFRPAGVPSPVPPPEDT